MVRLLAMLVLLTGCAYNPVQEVVVAAELSMVIAHMDDSPEEYVAWIDERMRRQKLWCTRDRSSWACEQLDALRKEKHRFLKTGERIY